MKKLSVLMVITIVFMAAGIAGAVDKNVSIKWEQDCIAGCPDNTPPVGAVDGWRIYVSDVSGTYGTTPIIDIPYDGTPAPSYSSAYVLILTGAGTKYFVVTAYNQYNETGYSIEANYPYNFAGPATPVSVTFTIQAP